MNIQFYHFGEKIYAKKLICHVEETDKTKIWKNDILIQENDKNNILNL